MAGCGNRVVCVDILWLCLLADAELSADRLGNCDACSVVCWLPRQVIVAVLCPATEPNICT
jgi:hypothetical protein